MFRGFMPYFVVMSPCIMSTYTELPVKYLERGTPKAVSSDGPSTIMKTIFLRGIFHPSLFEGQSYLGIVRDVIYLMVLLT